MTRTRTGALVITAAALLAELVEAGPAQRVKDVAGGEVPVRALVGDVTVHDSRLFFTSLDEAHGIELWSSDGTSEGTRLVQDILPGRESSVPAGFLGVGERLVFAASENFSGSRMWSSDGTAAGTSMIVDHAPGTLSFVEALAALPGAALFGVRSGSSCELWRTDGTVAGTSMLHEICSNAQAATLGGAAFFAGEDARGIALWSSDGTVEGTRFVRDVWPEWLVALNGAVLFAGYDALHGTELWSSDGTAEGTRLVLDIVPGSAGGDPSFPVVAGQSLYFFATSPGAGLALWRSDGSPEGTQLVTAVQGIPSHALAAGARVVCVLRSSSGTKLWASDGTIEGTVDLGSIEPSTQSSGAAALTSLDGVAYVLARDGTGSMILWRSDGTPGGTRRVAALPGALRGTITPAVIFDGALYFNTSANEGSLLWRTDGTEAGTVVFRGPRLGPASSELSFPPPGSASAGARYFFTATDGIHGTEVWTSDGTEDGTSLLRDVLPGSQSSEPWALTAAGDRVYFSATRGMGSELWTSDGSPSGTRILKDLCPCPGRYDSYEMVAAGDDLYFGLHRNPGWELWRSDGTEGGTLRLAEGRSAGGTHLSLTEADGTLFFRDYDSVERYRLWKSDGTAAGTLPIKNIDPTWSGQYGTVFGASSGALYFSVLNGADAHGIWRSDGTPEGTERVSPIFPSSRLFDSGGRLFFAAPDPDFGDELWTSDGTSGGTHVVADILPGAAGSLRWPSLVGPADLGGVLYFAAKDAGHGTELWSSDGTSDGTTLVKDIWPGPSGSSPQSLFVVEGVLFFTASDGTSGQELWRSDGTAEGTVLVQDIAPGVASSSPRRIAAAGGRLFFYADDGASGAEPWSGRLSLLAGRPRQAIEELRDEVLAEALPPGIATSLLAKLDRALRALGGHDSPAALRALGALRSQLQALAGNQVPAGTAEEWAGFVRSIAELLESGEGGAEPADYMQDWGSELTRSRPPWPAPSVPIPQVASMPWIR